MFTLTNRNTLAVTAGNAKWWIRQSTGSLRTHAGRPSSGYGISEAHLISPSRTDGFDGAVGISVNGKVFIPPAGKVDLTTTAAGTFVNIVTPQNIGGVNTSLNYFFTGTGSTVRAVGVFTNTTGTTLTINVGVGGNLGSDRNTEVLRYASGGSTLSLTQDNYVISHQKGQTGDLGDDPHETWVFFGPGGKTPFFGAYQNGNDIIGEEWSLTLAPGQTEELMWFVQLNPDLASALSGSSTFASLSALTSAGLLSGLSASDLAEIENWLAISTGPILQNSAPVNIPTTADFLVGGPVVTGGGNNTVNSLTFLSGSSLKIFNTLTVTTGPVELVNGSSIDLENATFKVNQLNIDFGGFLGGNGTIFGNLFNAGTISPGHSPGQIHLTGNFVQGPTGTLVIQFAGHSKGQFDVFSVDGSAKLNGTLQLQALDKFKLRRGDNFQFLTAGGGISGKFADVVNPFVTDTILNPRLVYRGQSVSLEVRTFQDFANAWDLTPNQKSVARALDSINYDSRADKLTNYVDNRPLPKLPGDFVKIAPEELTSMYTIGVALEKVQSLNIQRRTDDIRSGLSGFSAAGFAINGDGPSFSGPMNRGGVAGPNGSDDKDSKMRAVPLTDERWGAFLSGTGEWVSVGDTDNARGYDLESGGFTLGADYKVTPNFAIGLAAGYTGTTADLVDGGRIHVNGGKLGLYGTFYQNQPVAAAPTMSKDSSKDSKEVQAPAASVAKGLYADFAAFGGYNSYDTHRSGLQGTARGDTDGGELNVLFGTGYDFKKGNLTFGPTATFNYTYLGTSEFTEHGSLAPLNVHGGKGESLRSAFGFKASYDWKVGGVLIKPELSASWQHEYGDSAYAIDSSFANGAGNSFLVNGPKLGRDSALLGAGFAVQFNERMSTYFYYDGELGRTNYQSSSVTGGFRIAF
ncbi:autotransporter family protein [Chthoniobacter flavus]|uniref:autotransporter family protein n=1 Tax=Chthoniobacter flavus TaxID=191863 RepID=UPI001ED92E57|nr:autotransporter outer membrane beta-barrel domain-containing protein [Chthoniobacter flavus]